MRPEFKYKPEDCPLKDKHFTEAKSNTSQVCPGCGAIPPGAIHAVAMQTFIFHESVGKVTRLT